MMMEFEAFYFIFIITTNYYLFIYLFIFNYLMFVYYSKFCFIKHLKLFLTLGELTWPGEQIQLKGCSVLHKKDALIEVAKNLPKT